MTGSYTQETDGKVTTTTYACADSYGLSGSSTSDCRSDGTWDSLTPTCGKLENLAPFILKKTYSLDIQSYGVIRGRLFKMNNIVS